MFIRLYKTGERKWISVIGKLKHFVFHLERERERERGGGFCSLIQLYLPLAHC